ncbi:winged helix-turn-helix transcriptional regulator [Endomicrobium proavitum]|uniref:Transcriptional regulator n=1 Tax=Endomicrobium proavitum TaxID=1408281 RepID=A0A0G3WJ69_9BACT|nr:helix-turn-helix domain-containing protein [Endomicrobium proavitum]AKL98373.1 Transcriptional regulator [Endomicrobium proavitum]
MIKKTDLPPCPTATTIHLIGNKWKLLLLRDLLDGTKRFGELRKSVAGISQKVLTENLRELEKSGIITRKVHAQVPPKVEYTLSKLGATLKPILDLMTAWGMKYKKMMR